MHCRILTVYTAEYCLYIFLFLGSEGGPCHSGTPPYASAHGHIWTSPHLLLTQTPNFAQLDLLYTSHTNISMTELYKPFIVMHVI